MRHVCLLCARLPAPHVLLAVDSLFEGLCFNAAIHPDEILDILVLIGVVFAYEVVPQHDFLLSLMRRDDHASFFLRRARHSAAFLSVQRSGTMMLKTFISIGPTGTILDVPRSQRRLSSPVPHLKQGANRTLQGRSYHGRMR